MEHVEVAVVGAGVIGSATARALGARGVPTALLEQFQPGHSRGSSHGATRVFRLSYPDPFYVAMAVAARGAWDRLEHEAGEELLVTTGGLDAGPGARMCADALAECGVPHTWLDAGQITTRFPGIGVAADEQMLFQPGAGVCLAGRTVRALQRLAARAGVPTRPHIPVLAIEPRGDRVALRTGRGEIEARTVVVTAGPWSAPLLTGVVSAVPALTATVQQVRYYLPRAPADRWPALLEWPARGPVWYTVPQAGGAPGVKVAVHAPGRPVDPRQGPFAQTDPALDEVADSYVGRRLPGLVPAGREPETCLYTMTPDEDFVLDREGPVVVGAGFSGHAFKFAPLLGEMLAGLAMGEDIGAPRDRFSLSRPALANGQPG